MEILIVDDSKAMRMIVRRTLRQAGCEAHNMDEAGNGKEALEKLRAKAFHLVLSDWNMPEMSGLELLQTLQKDGPKVKFGFVTSEGTDEMKNLARQNGALFLVTKPFTVENFKETIGPHIA